jgi:hypothetical protein
VRPVVALALAIGIAAAPAARQAAPQRPQFRAEVEVVEVDVSVLDARRRPVRGLTAADFTVAEDDASLGKTAVRRDVRFVRR